MVVIVGLFALENVMTQLDRGEKLEQTMTVSPGPWLLVSDVDDTLIGHEQGLIELIELVQSSQGQLILAVNSSRPHDSVMGTMRSLPGGFMPKAVITALGTEIAIDGEMLTDWQDRFASFKREVVDEMMTGRFELEPHRDEMQTLFKASFYLTQNDPVSEIVEAVTSLEMPLRTIVSHHDTDLDVIPECAGKGTATLELAKQLGIDPDHVIVAGDSANDVLMFNAVDRAIAVGNARDELRKVADPSKTFFASRPQSAGIVEGLQHYGVITR